MGGWVTLYLCSWRTPTTSCINASTTSDPAANAALDAAYARGLNVIARIGNPYVVREHADDAAAKSFTNYTSLAAAYARLIGSLPPPPAQADGSTTPLYVTVGNEFNACNEWRCTASAVSDGVMSSEQMQREVAAFARDVAAALAPLRRIGSGRWRAGQLRLGVPPLPPTLLRVSFAQPLLTLPLPLL